MNSILTKNQKKTFGPKIFTENGQKYNITATIRYDDECGNGHNSFSVTGNVYIFRGNKWCDDCGGCIHDQITQHFPELQKYIKWHLFDSNGPMHYVANTVFLAGDRDCWGYRKGEQKRNKEGLLCCAPKDWTNKFIDSNEKPTGSVEYEAVFGEGKARELDLARSAAVWPEATDEQLCSEPEVLKVLLMERLPGLIEDFKRDVESLGFVF